MGTLLGVLCCGVLVSPVVPSRFGVLPCGSTPIYYHPLLGEPMSADEFRLFFDLFLGTCFLLLLGICVLWIVMPGGVEPGVPSKLMWGNLFPWIKND